MSEPASIEVIDSHTGGEPTRVVIAGGPDLGSGPGAESHLEATSSEDSSPFSAIGQSHSDPPASFSAPASAPAGLSGYGDSGDQDKVDELLRQFKERYGRK